MMKTDTKNAFNLLPQELQNALTSQGITEPTPIQAQAISPALEGKDVLGTAQTGTGKTFAFLLPILTRMQQDPQAGSALVLAPTRELAQQIYDALKTVKPADPHFRCALVIGGDNIEKQFAELRKKPRFIIATPGRVMDHMGRKSIDLTRISFWVLDETDRMLDMGFIKDMRRIEGALPKDRQTLMFSATMPTEITDLAHKFLKDPVRIKIGSVTRTIDLVAQEIVCLAVREKLTQLVHELETRQGSILVFVKTKHGAERLAKQLKMYGVKVNAIHGDLRQNRRKQVLDAFRDESMRVLVATDVAARGIDVPHIAHVINYDLPQCPEDYIHRIGRTGRAGAVGSALSFIAGDEDQWRAISDVTQFGSPVVLVEKTNKPLPAPKFVPEEEDRGRSAIGRNSGRPLGGRAGGRTGGGRNTRSDRPSRSFRQGDAASEEQETASYPSRPARAFHKAADAERFLEDAAQLLRQEAQERDRRSKMAEERYQKSQARSANQAAKKVEDKPSRPANKPDRGAARGNYSARGDRPQKGPRRTAQGRPVIERRIGTDGVKVVRVGASKSNLRRKLDATVRNVKHKLSHLGKDSFSKFFKKQK